MVLTGIDRLSEGTADFRFRGKAALLTNQSGVTRSLGSSVDVLSSLTGIDLSILLSPEHGLYGEAQDQVLLDEREDPLSGLPIVTLYGDLRQPKHHHLKRIDVVFVDIQDVGSRYYTFIYTMALLMRAAREAGTRVAVLDRPNPIGGKMLEGNVVREGYETFVGLFPLAVRHGMTIGELALFFNDYCGVGSDLTVVSMEGWKRGMMWEDTGLPWIPPSPNMPLAETALVYPGMCLLEGTNLSEGRGTTRPFEVFGAPFIDPKKLIDRMSSLSLPGVVFRPVFFEPVFGKWAGERCGGLWIHVTDRLGFKPFLTAVCILREVRSMYSESFTWLDPPYEYEENILPIDMLFGTDSIRKAIERGAEISEIEKSWMNELESFRIVRREYLLYS